MKQINMNRRKFLTTVAATSTTAALAGCTGGGSMSPEEVSEAYFKALIAGDYEKITTHVEGDLDGKLTESFVIEQKSIAERTDAEISGTTLISSSETEAVTEVVMTLTTPFGPQTSTTRFELEKIDGRWMIVDAETE